MASDRFLIAPFSNDSGLETDVRPWLISDKAFAKLDNAYEFRGRIRKRFGSRFVGPTVVESRLRIKIGTVDGAGNFVGFTPWSALFVPTVPMAIGQLFIVGNVQFTVTTLGASVNLLRSDGSANPATYSNIGQFTLNNELALALFDVYFYPGLPVMGLRSLETSDYNDEPTIAFDTHFAYKYINGWERLNLEADLGASTWYGSDTQFFWTTNWQGASPADYYFFVTNFNENEPNFMRYLDPVKLWHDYDPICSVLSPKSLNIRLISARILIPYKNRLLALNTWEEEDNGGPATVVNYSARVRWTQLGSPIDPVAWRQDIPGKGNGLDAPTTESIISVEFVKDRLIVFFERSTWELAYTGNQINPFVWNKLNTELGVESTFSIVPFDKVAIGIGNVGIMACNGSNVERIDEKIPQVVFDIHKVDQGIFRVYGIRDYVVEMVYWTFPSDDTTALQPYPNRVFVFNYKTGTWAFNDDSITCFGFFQPVLGATWSSKTILWNSEITWNTGPASAKERIVIAGNQQGYTFIVDPDNPTNAPVLQITNVAIVPDAPGCFVTFTVINHNLRENDYIYIRDMQTTGTLSTLNGTIQQVMSSVSYPIGQNTFTILIDASILTGTYLGAGLLARVSQLRIATKEYNFYAQEGRNAAINKVDFMVDRTLKGEVEVQFYASTSIDNLLTASGPYPGTGALIGTGTLDTFPYTTTIPFEQYQTRLWHPLYIQAEGECIQLYLTMNDVQMRDLDVWQSNFQLHAMLFNANKTSSRLQ